VLAGENGDLVAVLDQTVDLIQDEGFRQFGELIDEQCDFHIGAL